MDNSRLKNEEIENFVYALHAAGAKYCPLNSIACKKGCSPTEDDEMLPPVKIVRSRYKFDLLLEKSCNSSATASQGM